MMPREQSLSNKTTQNHFYELELTLHFYVRLTANVSENEAQFHVKST